MLLHTSALFLCEFPMRRRKFGCVVLAALCPPRFSPSTDHETAEEAEYDDGCFADNAVIRHYIV